MDVLTRRPQVNIYFYTRKIGAITFASIAPSLVQVRAHRRMGETAGAFQIVLKPNKLSNKLWQDVIEPMDYVEIRLTGNGPIPLNKPSRNELANGALLMRGFVDVVGITGSIGGGTPERVITINGRDYGKIALIFTLYSYTLQTNPRMAIIQVLDSSQYQIAGQPDPALGQSRAGTSTSAPQRSSDQRYNPQGLMQFFFNQLFVPHMNLITANLVGPDGVLVLPKLDFTGLDAFVTSSLETINPTFNSETYSPSTPIWQVMEKYANMPWCELFFDDDDFSSSLIFRTTPWFDPSGQPVVAGTTPYFTSTVTGAELIDWDFNKSDQEVFNLIASQPELYEPLVLARLALGDITGTIQALGAAGDNPTIIGGTDDAPAPPGTPSDVHRFGLREFSKNSSYFGLVRGDATVDQTLLSSVGTELNRRLVLAFGHNEVLWNGNITIKGRTDIHIGDYMRLNVRGNITRFYVEGVSHEFTAATQQHDGSYTTNLILTRGQPDIGPINQALSPIEF